MRARSVRRCAVLAVLALASSAVAGTVTLDFESLALNDALDHDAPSFYLEDGYRVSSLGGGNDFLGTLRSNFAGSTALHVHASNSEMIFSKLGAHFDFLGVDLALFTNSNPTTVRFVGFRGNIGVVQQTFSLTGGSFAEQHFDATGFTDLTSLRLEQGTLWTQVDNVVLQDHVDPASVPLPTSAALGGVMLSGLLARAAVRRRRARAATR